MVEKDYVLGWVLFGLMQIQGLVFKGGTALAKVYFPQTWRLSEDLDFVTAPAKWKRLPGRIPKALEEATARSGVQLAIKSQHSNPGYLQVKIQYSGPLGKNWLKVDVTPEYPIGKVLNKPLSRSYSDYPDFTVRVESLEEIFAQKLRALVQRKKVRDYYDIWKMGEQKIDQAVVAKFFVKKLKAKEIKWDGLQDVFPPDLETILKGYWEKELGRLVWPVPPMSSVLAQLKTNLNWLNTVRVR
ncbi:MAG: nucleotidyl transferase AbiEii/AbiGii toxin family protein [Planctomycetota bacterium]|nr:nucleotidyl transferase AbiEii/AbiGii toxin family protein [Planctomycetota bacterium]